MTTLRTRLHIIVHSHWIDTVMTTKFVVTEWRLRKVCNLLAGTISRGYCVCVTPPSRMCLLTWCVPFWSTQVVERCRSKEYPMRNNIYVVSFARPLAQCRLSPSSNKCYSFRVYACICLWVDGLGGRVVAFLIVDERLIDGQGQVQGAAAAATISRWHSLESCEHRWEYCGILRL